MSAFLALTLASMAAAQVGGGWLEFTPLPAAANILALEPLGDLDGDGTDDLLLGLQDESVQVLSGRTGGELLRLTAPIAGAQFGAAVAAIGDLNGDLIPDFVVSASAELGVGVVRIYSGANAAPLHVITGTVAGANFGWKLLAPGDLNSDGIGDLLVATPGNPTAAGGSLPGTLTAFSGATALTLYGFHYPRETRSFATAMVALTDLNGDSIPDYAVGAPDASVAGTFLSGEVLVLSGTDGRRMMNLSGGPLALLGERIASAGDVDGDFRPDLYVNGSIYSLRTGAWIRMLAPDLNTAYHYGDAVGGIDFTGDGLPELVIGVPRLGRSGAWQSGGCHVFDPRTGRILQTLYGRSDEQLGDQLAVLRRLGGDELPDVAIGSSVMSMARGYGFDSLLELDPPTISAVTGGSVRIELTFPTEEEGRRYLLLASVSGTGPTQFGGIQVPLTVDALYLRMLASPPGILQNGRGRLASDASATATLRFLPGAASLWIGRSIQFAAVSYEGVLARVSSRPVAFTVLP